MGCCEVGGTTPVTCARVTGAPGGGSRARNPARHFPGSALRARRGRGGLTSLGKGDEARGNSGKLGVGDGPGLWLESPRAPRPLPPERLFPFLSGVRRAGREPTLGRGLGVPGPGQPGLNPFPPGLSSWRRPGPGRPARPAPAAGHTEVEGLTGHALCTYSYS